MTDGQFDAIRDLLERILEELSRLSAGQERR